MTATSRSDLARPGAGAPMSAADGLPVAALVKQASEQLSQLMHQEMRLAAVEVRDKAKHGGVGAGLLGGAGILAAYGMASLLVAVGAALALVLPVWLAALLIAVVLFGIGAGLALSGRKQISRAVPPVPEQAIDSTRIDIAEIRGRAHR